MNCEICDLEINNKGLIKKFSFFVYLNTSPGVFQDYFKLEHTCEDCSEAIKAFIELRKKL